MKLTSRIRTLSRTALLCALLCVLSVMTLPIGAVPITLGTLGVFLCGLLLPPKSACAAVLGYLLLGAIGLPVFSSMQGGIGILAGITGGYLWGYLPAIAAMTSLRSILCRRAKKKSVLPDLCAGITALLLCYFCGTVQFLLLSDTTLAAALAVCVLPFLPFDILKLIFAITLSARFRRHL